MNEPRMSLWQRLQALLCPTPARSVPTWFWSGKVGYEFAEGDGTWPIDMLHAGKLQDMIYDGDAENTWPELDGSEKFYGHFWDGQTVWEIRRQGYKRPFVWGFPGATYGKDGHPHPNAGKFWLDADALDGLWKAIDAHRRRRT